MGTLKEEAEAYETPKTRNISELERIPVNLQVEEREFTKEDGTTFTVKVVVLNDEDYRVPVSVLKNLKAMVAEKPELKEFKVSKTGEGLKTEYTVIPLD
ncbi:hypothetical protein LCGC14_0546010 [marine sediment metagenome]|uniref:Uncharacterized protein n=1 Tax=marine sediment metagenome TaxID=412755 RepID=A0A0F9UCS0_9ZZZZ